MMPCHAKGDGQMTPRRQNQRVIIITTTIIIIITKLSSLSNIV
jgi:hypothetical protein